MSHNELQVIHNVTLRLFDAQGNLKDERLVHNIVTTVGKGHIADQLASSPAQGVMGYMAIGTGATAAAITDTTLQTEVARVALTSRTAASGVVTYVCTFAAGTGTATITESGIFNAASVGTLLAHVVFGAITKGASDSLQITHTLTFS